MDSDEYNMFVCAPAMNPHLTFQITLLNSCGLPTGNQTVISQGVLKYGGIAEHSPCFGCDSVVLALPADHMNLNVFDRYLVQENFKWRLFFP